MKKLLLITQKVDARDQLLGFFIDWLKRFAGKFETVTILCLEKGEFKLPENVKVISLGKDRGSSKPAQLFNFYKNIHSLDYDAVFVHMNPIWVILGGPAWKIMRRKIFFWYTHKAVTPKLKLAEKFADTIFTASKESFRLPSKKVIVTGHGIDTELFKPNSSYKLQAVSCKLLSVGRIAPIKNYGTLIDAVKNLKDKSIDVSVTMIGEAPLKQDELYELGIKSKIKSLNLEDKFKFLGKVSHKDLPGYYQSHDIFIHLSKTGSVDKSLLEAMACGIKVLSSNDSSRAFLPEQLLFDENNPKELAEKIVALSKAEVDPKLRQYVVENHNLDKLIDRISSLIKQK